MPKFEPKNYPEFKDVVDQALLTMYMTGQEIYRFPTVLSAIIVTNYSLDSDSDTLREVYDYMEKACAKMFSSLCLIHTDEKISWKNMPGTKLFIWREILGELSDDVDKMIVVHNVCDKVLKRKHLPEQEMWLGVYITECVDVMTSIRPEMQLEFHLYGSERDMFKGKFQKEAAWWYSNDERGIVEDDRVLMYFEPTSVCINTGLYDDVSWSELSSEEKNNIISRYNIPSHLEEYMETVWRGHPIYTGDIIKLEWFEDDKLVESETAMYTEEGEDLSLRIFSKKKKKFSDAKLEKAHITILGNIHDDKEWAELYESILTAQLFNN